MLTAASSPSKSAVSAVMAPAIPGAKVTVHGPPALPLTITLPTPTLDSAASRVCTVAAEALWAMAAVVWPP